MTKKTTKNKMTSNIDVNRLITNKSITNWQIEQMNEWDGRALFGLMCEPVQVSITMPISNAKQAENAQQLDLINFHLDQMKIPTKNNIGFPLSTVQRMLRLMSIKLPSGTLEEGDALWIVDSSKKRFRQDVWCERVREEIGEKNVEFFTNKELAEARVNNLKESEKNSPKNLKNESPKQNKNTNSSKKRKVREQSSPS